MNGSVPTVDFRLETNESIPANLALAIAGEIVRLARLRSAFGPEVQIEIVELGRGSLTIKLAIAANLATVATFGALIYDRLQSGSGKLPELVAEACLDHGVTSCHFKGEGIDFAIARSEMPAVAQAKDRGDKYRAKIPSDRQAEHAPTISAEPAKLALTMSNVRTRPSGRRAFVGEFSEKAGEIVFTMGDGYDVLPRGNLDFHQTPLDKEFVLIGEIVDHDSKLGIDILDVSEVLPLG